MIGKALGSLRPAWRGDRTDSLLRVGQPERASVACFVAAAPPFPQPRALDALALSEGMGMFSLAF